jgi:hypothetical protein
MDGGDESGEYVGIGFLGMRSSRPRLPGFRAVADGFVEMEHEMRAWTKLAMAFLAGLLFIGGAGIAGAVSSGAGGGDGSSATLAGFRYYNF